jgi:hypothetical protein
VRPVILSGIWLLWSLTGVAQTLPFSTDSTHITVWNGETHVPLFIKGINLGVGIPGTFPGDMGASTGAGLNFIAVYSGSERIVKKVVMMR